MAHIFGPGPKLGLNNYQILYLCISPLIIGSDLINVYIMNSFNCCILFPQKKIVVYYEFILRKRLPIVNFSFS